MLRFTLDEGVSREGQLRLGPELVAEDPEWVVHDVPGGRDTAPEGAQVDERRQSGISATSIRIRLLIRPFDS
jgi:hypothetical protein